MVQDMESAACQDMAAWLRGLPVAPVPEPARPEGEAAVRIMTDQIVELAQGGEPVTRADFERWGWTGEEIDRWAGRAIPRAALFLSARDMGRRIRLRVRAGSGPMPSVPRGAAPILP